jgi:hypothetical protein
MNDDFSVQHLERKNDATTDCSKGKGRWGYPEIWVEKIILKKVTEEEAMKYFQKLKLGRKWRLIHRHSLITVVEQ